MNDARVTVFTNPTAISGTGTTNGPSIDLWGGDTPAGGNFVGTGTNGTGFEILFDSISGGTNPTFDVKFQFSSDESTWNEGGYVGQVDDSETTARLVGTLRTRQRYARIVIVTAADSGTPTANVNAYATDHCGLYSEDIAWP